jgi:hypothetical protein
MSKMTAHIYYNTKQDLQLQPCEIKLPDDIEHDNEAVRRYCLKELRALGIENNGIILDRIDGIEKVKNKKNG